LCINANNLFQTFCTWAFERANFKSQRSPACIRLYERAHSAISPRDDDDDGAFQNTICFGGGKTECCARFLCLGEVFDDLSTAMRLLSVKFASGGGANICVVGGPKNIAIFTHEQRETPFGASRVIHHNPHVTLVVNQSTAPLAERVVCLVLERLCTTSASNHGF